MPIIESIPNALNNIINQCESKLTELYPGTIPTVVKDRYEHEINCLRKSQFIDDFEIFRLLSKQADKCSSFITLRGTTAGSFLIYLINSTHWNPLPVHYHCPECGSFELVDTSLFSFDLPDKPCSGCGQMLHADGYNLSTQSVWGLDGKKYISFEYNIPRSFMPFAKKTLSKLYSDNTIVPYGLLTQNKKTAVPCMEHDGFMILPKNQTIEDYPDYQGYLEDGDVCLSCSLLDLESLPLRRISLYPLKIMDLIFDMQNGTGLFINEITRNSLKEISLNNISNTYIHEAAFDNLLHLYKPRTFTRLCELAAVTHNAYANVPRNESGCLDSTMIQRWIDSDIYSQCICSTREDIYDHLIRNEFSSEDAYTISEIIRKGRACSKPETLEEYSLPPEIMDAARKCQYLFPRAHVIEYTFLYHILAYYVRNDCKMYRKVTAKCR